MIFLIKNKQTQIFFLSTPFFYNITKDLILLKILTLHDLMYAMPFFNATYLIKKLKSRAPQCCSFIL